MALLEEDRGLLDAFRAGRADALEAVYRAYVRDVNRLVRLGFAIDHARRVPGVTDPDAQLDIAQEVFTRAFSDKGRQSYDGLRPYRPFLLRIAKNHLIDRARKSGRELLAKSDEQALQVDALIDRNVEMPAVEGDLDWQRQREATKRFMDALNLEERRFVELRFIERLAQAVVAERLHTTRRQVMNTEATVLKRLKAYLTKERVL